MSKFKDLLYEKCKRCNEPITNSTKSIICDTCKAKKIANLAAAYGSYKAAQLAHYAKKDAEHLLDAYNYFTKNVKGNFQHDDKLIINRDSNKKRDKNNDK